MSALSRTIAPPPSLPAESWSQPYVTQHQDPDANRVVNLRDERTIDSRTSIQTPLVLSPKVNLLYDKRVDLVNLEDHQSSPSSMNHTQKLNLQLQQAVRGTDQTLCRYLIEMRANVNAKNEAGQTPLQIALARKNLSISKILIDNAAQVSDADKEKIVKAFKSSGGVGQRDLRYFLIQRPNPNVPEVWVGSSTSSKPFVPLTTIIGKHAQVNFTKPIFLQLIADDVLEGKNYGAVTKEFQEFPVHLLSPYFTVIRVFVDRKERLATTICCVQESLPGLAIAHVILHGHSNNEFICIGKDSRLTTEDRALMRKIAKCVHPCGTITLDGCGTGKRHYNIAKIFSQQAFGRIIYGSPFSSTSMDCSVFLNADEGIPPLFMPYFIPSESDDSVKHVDTYESSNIQLPNKINVWVPKESTQKFGYVYIFHNGYKIAACNNVHNELKQYSVYSYFDKHQRPCLEKITALQKAKLLLPLPPSSADEDSPAEHAVMRKADFLQDIQEDATGTSPVHINFV